MRTSCDQYKTKEGTIVDVFGMEMPPEGATIWNGFDYKKQYWIMNGEKDTRTLEELEAELDR